LKFSQTLYTMLVDDCAPMAVTSLDSTNVRAGASAKSARWARFSDRQLRIGAWLAVAAYLVGFLISAAYRSQSDFTIYRNAGLAAAAGRPIYSLLDWSPFQYAPIYAVIFIPFGWLSPRWAQLLWFAVSMAAALPALIVGTYRLLLGPGTTLRANMIVLPLILIVRFLHPNFDHGQINLVLIAMIVWGLSLTCESKPALGGLLLAASMLIKPLALPAIAYLLFRRRFSVIIAMIAFYLVLLCLPSLFLGLRPALGQTIGYFTSLLTRLPLNRLSHDLLSTYNQSASAVAVRLFSPAARGMRLMSQARAAALGFAFNAALLGLAIWIAGRDRTSTYANDRWALAAIFCFVPSFELLGWLEYYIALEIPYAALVAELAGKQPEQPGTRVIYAVLASTFVINVSSRFVGAGLYYGAPYFCSLAILVTLLWSRRLVRSKSGDVAATS
jgi:hypothetical protein